MGLYITNSLNRIADIEGDDDDYYDLSEKLEKIAKKYNLGTKISAYGCHESSYFVIHNNEEEGRSYHLYEGHFIDLPTVEDDETFLQRSEDFIKEASDIYKDFKQLKFGNSVKRMFISS